MPEAPERKIKLFFEINQAYDTGWFFTDGYADDTYYTTNGEPSLVYAADMDFDKPQTGYAFELAGYGHHAGRDGKLHEELTAPDSVSGTARSKFEHATHMVQSIQASGPSHLILLDEIQSPVLNSSTVIPACPESCSTAAEGFRTSRNDAGILLFQLTYAPDFHIVALRKG